MQNICKNEEVTLKGRAARLLTNPRRLEILSMLGLGDHSLREMAVMLKISPVRLASHLNLLYQVGLVCRYRKAQQEYYRIVDPVVARTSGILYGMWSERLAGVGA